MLHIKDNIKIVRALLKESQDDFRQRFTGVSLSMQKSYEQGAANPGVLYIAEIAELAGVSEKEIRNKKLSKEDIKLSGSKPVKGEKDYKDENVPSGTSEDQKHINKTGDLPASRIDDILACNKALADAALEQAKRDVIREEKERDMVKTNLELLRMIKTTSPSSEENPLANPDVQMKLLEALAALGSGARWSTKEEALIALGNMISVPGNEEKKSGGTHAGAGKKSIAKQH